MASGAKRWVGKLGVGKGPAPLTWWRPIKGSPAKGEGSGGTQNGARHTGKGGK